MVSACLNYLLNVTEFRLTTFTQNNHIVILTSLDDLSTKRFVAPVLFEVIAGLVMNAVGVIGL